MSRITYPHPVAPGAAKPAHSAGAQAVGAPAAVDEAAVAAVAVVASAVVVSADAASTAPAVPSAVLANASANPAAPIPFELTTASRTESCLVCVGSTSCELDAAPTVFSERSASSAPSEWPERGKTTDSHPGTEAHDSETDDVSRLIATLRDSGLKVEREDVSEPFLLTSEQRLAVYSVVQECLVNVLLHGDRSQNTVVLFEWSVTALELTIASALRPDPISEGAGEALEGGGLVMMRRSVEQLGGTFEAHAGYGRWVVAADFPRWPDALDLHDLLAN